MSATSPTKPNDPSSAPATWAQRARLALVVAGLFAGIAMAMAAMTRFAVRSATFDEVSLFLAGVVVFAVCAALSGQLFRRSFADIEERPEPPTRPGDRPFLGPAALAAAGLAVAAGLVTFGLSGDGLFEVENSFFWIAGMALFLGALLEYRGRTGISGLYAWLTTPRQLLPNDLTRLWPALVLLAIVGVGAFLRLYQLGSTPLEMMSDHAEKALDIQTVLDGKFPIYFDRNTGREPFHMYVAAGLVKFAGVDFSFFAIKLATVLPAILMVPATYLMTREFFDNRKIALLAAAFAAVAFWPILTGRVGLRFAYGQLFIALTLAYFLRAVKYRQRNDFLLCGLMLGFGMYSYMAFRVMPLVIAVCLLLVIAVDIVRGRGRPDWRFVGNATILGTMALLVYAPLARYAISFREQYWTRIQSRGGGSEAPVEAPFATFIDNVRDGFLMFNWQGDVVWVLNISFKPGLDFAMGALMALGALVLLLRWLRHRDLPTVFFAIAFLALMLPTVLSIAFPAENPAFGRASGLLPLVFVLVALPVYLVAAAVRRLLPQWWGAVAVVGVATGLVVWVGVIDFQDYHNDYDARYKASAHNTTEVASAMLNFADRGPGIEGTFFVVHPFWVDTRNLALELGDFGWDNIIPDIEDVDLGRDTPNPKLYILHQEDVTSLQWLTGEYPAGIVRTVRSAVGREKDFVVFITAADPVPAAAAP